MENIPTKVDGVDTLPAAEFNQIPSELENLITSTGIALTSSDLFQAGKSVANYSAHGDYYTDSGTPNAYILTEQGSKQAPTGYVDGMRIRCVIGNTNTGASTVNVSTLGVKSIVNTQGNALVGGELIAGQIQTMIFDNSADKFVLMPTVITDFAPASIASAATVNIGTATSRNVEITGTTTVTSFGTVGAGVVRNATALGAFIITHNATSLILPGAGNITTAVGDSFTAISLGSGNWRIINYEKADGTPIVGSGITSEMLRVEDQKTSGTDGGSSSAGTWQTRVLNTVVTNTLSGASLATNQITLAAGTYRVFARAPVGGAGVLRHKIRLRNITDSTTTAVGSSEYAPNGASLNSFIHDIEFTIAAAKTFELQHWMQVAGATTGLGVATSSGEVEVYASVAIVKIG